MVAYSFRQQFVAPILSGAKCQTIRADRKRHARAGEEMQLYTGMRTKYCRLIGRATCLGTVSICLDFPNNHIRIGDAVYFGWKNLDTFARQDGFDGWLSTREFWRQRHGTEAWTGILIRWTGLVRASPPEYPDEWPPGPPPRGQHDA